MSTLYFWKNGRVEEVHQRLSAQQARALGWMLYPCVDTFEDEPRWRYGVFMTHTNWQYVDPKDFPPEFRTHLLLLGVT